MSRQAVLFTPGDRFDMLGKGLTSGADTVVFDIEDAVAPQAKDQACENIVSYLSEIDANDIDTEICIRINQLGYRGIRDLEAIASVSDKFDSIMLPMIDDVGAIEILVQKLGYEGIDANIIAVIETPMSVINLSDIAFHPSVDGIGFGAEDLTTAIGGIHTYDREEVKFARQKVVIATSAAGIDAIDMGWPDFKDLDGLRKNTREAVTFGFTGKVAIHPSQIEVIHEEFTPSEEELEWSQKVVTEADRLKDEHKVLFQLDGEMIDPPIISRARMILDRANLDS